MPRSVVVGHGSYLPEKIVTNDDLAKTIDTSDAWITERTGIKERHIAAEGEGPADMAAIAAKKALEKAGLTADDLDLIIVATTTPDNTFPSTATKLQALLGMKNGAGFDVQAVCAGFIYALSVADKFIRSGECTNVLVVGAETLSRIVNWEDRGTCILFGDGAGALILQAQDSDRGILSTHIHSDGSTRDLLYVNGGAGTTGSSGTIRMEGKEVFKHAASKLAACTQEALDANNLAIDDVDWAVPHQANVRIMDAMAKKLGLPKEKVINTIAGHANTSAASIPLALAVALEDGYIKHGDIVILQAIGGGLSWGSCAIRW